MRLEVLRYLMGGGKILFGLSDGDGRIYFFLEREGIDIAR